MSQAPFGPPPPSQPPYPRPSKIGFDTLKSKLLAPSLTSHYQCWFNPPALVTEWLKVKQLPYESEFISLLCSEAVLPGSSLMTNDINDDFTGVTERHAYRRQYDDRADFTFYVDKERYYSVKFFDYWLSYISGEEKAEGLETNEYFYRVNYPKNYQSSSLYVVKFEKDYAGNYLQYRLLQAYPISISSMPVSYDSSQLLKCTVSFTYTRYIIDSLSFPQIIPQSQGGITIIGAAEYVPGIETYEYIPAPGTITKAPGTGGAADLLYDGTGIGLRNPAYYAGT